MRHLILALLALATLQSFAKAPSTGTFATTAKQEFVKGFVQIQPDRRLWVEQRQAVNGKPTLFFLNGLTWSTTQWRPLVAALDKLDPEIGIVLYDMDGMGRTLLDKAPVTWNIPFASQIKDLKGLYDKLDIEGPKILAGLSYGGAGVLQYMADHPDDFDKAIAMAPFLEKLPEQDQWIRGMIKGVRQTNPYNPATDEELYAYFLRTLVYTTYPMAEPIMLENPYKTEGVYRMVLGSKDWRALDIVKKLPAGKMHIMAGQDDPYVKLPWLQSFWAAIPERAQASFLLMHDTQHKLPEERPDFTAAWIMEIVKNNPNLNRGLIFDGNPDAGWARNGDITIPLKEKKTLSPFGAFCDLILRNPFFAR